jgi:hypothetical protein
VGFFDRGKKKKRLEEAGVTAPAQLVSVQDTGVTVNNNPRVKLTLAVSPSDGSPPFEVSAKHTVSRVAVPRAGDVFTVRYDPEDHENFAFVAGGGGGGGAAQAVDLDDVSAGDIATAAGANYGQVQRGSAAELLATGQRMTAILREFSPTGKTVGDSNPAAENPSDPVYVFKMELPVAGGTPLEAICLNRVPAGKTGELSLGAQLNVAVNPANPTREVAIDWSTSPVAT